MLGGVTRAVLKIALLECRTRYIKWLTHITKLEPVAINQRSGFQSNDEGKSPKTELVSNVETDLNTDLRVLCFVFFLWDKQSANHKNAPISLKIKIQGETRVSKFLHQSLLSTTFFFSAKCCCCGCKAVCKSFSYLSDIHSLGFLVGSFPLRLPAGFLRRKQCV